MKKVFVSVLICVSTLLASCADSPQKFHELPLPPPSGEKAEASVNPDPEKYGLPVLSSGNMAGKYEDAYKTHWAALNAAGAMSPEAAYHIFNFLYSAQTLNKYEHIETLFGLLQTKFAGNIYVLARIDFSMIPANGYWLDGEFKRGRPDGNISRFGNSTERDSFVFLNLMRRAIPAADRCSAQLRGDFYFNFLRLIGEDRSYSTYHLKTDLDGKTPSIAEEHYFNYYVLPRWSMSENKAPFKDGKPLTYKVPKSFEAAENDGERIRFIVEKCAASGTTAALDFYATTLANQFDISSEWSIMREMHSGDAAARKRLMSLQDNETLVIDENGVVSNIVLPPELDYFSIFRRTKNHLAAAKLLCCRMRFNDALEEISKGLAVQSSTPEMTPNLKYLKTAIDSPAASPVDYSLKVTTPGKEPLKLRLEYRNTKSVCVDVYRVDTGKAFGAMLKNLKTGLKKEGSYLPTDMFNTRSVAPWKDCVGEKIESFNVALPEMKDHLLGTAPIDLGRKTPGAYYVKISIPGDPAIESAEVLLWVTPCAINVIQGVEHHIVTLNNAADGKPLASKKVTAWRFTTDYANTPEEVKEFGGKTRVTTKKFEFTTDADGKVLIKDDDFIESQTWNTQWLFKINDESTGILSGVQLYTKRGSDYYNARHTLVITDRPVYRPGDKVCFTVYPRNTSFEPKKFDDQKSISVTINSPRGRNLLDDTSFPFDPVTGSACGEVELPASAALGQYDISTSALGRNHGYASFRVEEYKKPEYIIELKKPEKPLTSGEKAVIECVARYHFGAPMRNATVNVTATRTPAFPAFPFFERFNWIYGKWYTVCSSSMRASFERIFSNYSNDHILSTTLKTDGNGQARLEFDPSQGLAKDFKGDFNVRVDFSVTDSSNRLVKSSADLRVSGSTFSVFIRQDKGCYLTGETVHLDIACVDSASNPVLCKGVVELRRRIINASGLPETEKIPADVIPFETRSSSDWPRVNFTIARKGVYEATVKAVSSESGIKVVEKTYIFVRGEAKADGMLSASPLELVRDKIEYRPGDKARIIVSSSNPDAFVYMNLRSERTCTVSTLQLENGSAEFSFDVTLSDMPNTYVSAYTCFDGLIHCEYIEIPIPPESRALDVEVKPLVSKASPGDMIPVSISVKDFSGKTVSGAVTISVYDKSLEQIAAYTPVLPQIFWSWRRQLDRYYDAHSSLSAQTQILKMMNPVSADYQSLPPFEFWRFAAFSRAYIERRVKGKREIFARDSEMSECSKSISNDSLVNGKNNPMPCMSPPAPESAFGMSDAATAADVSAAAVRHDFSDRPFWCARKMLDANGGTTVTVKAPENLTTWKVRVWSLTETGGAGEGDAEFTVTKDLVARLEIPRFTVQGDTVTAVANIHNLSDKPLKVKYLLSLDTDTVKTDSTEGTATLEASGDTAVKFKLSIPSDAKPGTAFLTFRALAENGVSDALVSSMPIVIRSSEITQVNAGRLAGKDNVASFGMKIPKKSSDATFTLRLSPGIAKNFTRILPYAVNSDSLDVFGTVNRLVPVAAAEHAFSRLGVKFEDLKLKKDARAGLLAEYMPHGENTRAAFEPEMFKKISGDAEEMIKSMRNNDGGWGWFSGYGEQSYPDTTAYVVDSLLDLKKLGREQYNGVISGGVKYLEGKASERLAILRKAIKDAEENHTPDPKLVNDTDALVLATLAKAGSRHTDTLSLLTLVYERARNLSPYGLVMLANAYPVKSAERADLLELISGYVEKNNETGTAYLRIPNEFRFVWSGNENETLARYMRLLLEADSTDPLLPRFAGYLVTNILNSPWRNSTRELGESIKALSEYVVATGETVPDMTVKILVNGMEKGTFKFDASNVWNDDPVMSIPPVSGSKISISTTGKGVLMYRGALTYMSYEKDIPAYGREMKIRRVYHLISRDGKGNETRTKLPASAKIKTSDEIEVELIVESDNDYDYVTVSDSLPAGFEYMETKSGYTRQWGAPIYCEFRERGPRFHMRNMSRGVSNITYRMRAQLDGEFNILPASGRGVYASELKCGTASDVILTGKE